jgi:hypothetical protein
MERSKELEIKKLRKWSLKKDGNIAQNMNGKKKGKIKMYKIEVKYNLKSPFMRVLTGTVQIGKINFGKFTNEDAKPFPFKKEPNCLGYQNFPAIFNRCKPLVNMIITSYFSGMIFANETHEWFNNCNRHNDEVIITFPD